MYTGPTIFSQLMQHVPWNHFHQCVDRYRGNHKVKEFKPRWPSQTPPPVAGSNSPGGEAADR